MMKTNYSMRIRSAITLTISFSLILSGVYFAWLSPLNEYPNYQEITRLSNLLKPGETSQMTFDVESGKKISYYFDSSYQNYNGTVPSTSPTFSVKVYDPNGEVIGIYEKIAYNLSQQTITVKNSGSHKIEITNIDSNTILVSSTIQEIKNLTRPLEPVGHWFIFMALPIIGLGIWFAIVKIEMKSNDSTLHKD